jgi:hypothetical protein
MTATADLEQKVSLPENPSLGVLSPAEQVLTHAQSSRSVIQEFVPLASSLN